MTPALLNLSSVSLPSIYFLLSKASGRALVVAWRLGCASAISLSASWRPASLPKTLYSVV